MTNSNDKPKVVKRDPAVTKERLLKAGLEDFGSKGYGGARTEGIAKNAGCNIRMLYHYFGSKEGLYLACLDRVYSKIRASERELNLRDLSPTDAITKLVEFTYDHMLNNKDFVQLAIVENTQRGRFLKKLGPLPNAASGLIATIEEILSRGTAGGAFRPNVDAVQLYISILSLSYLHLSNIHTLSVTYDQDLGDADWLSARRTHVVDMVTAYLFK